ncbi:G-protein coupled receptor 4-like [Mugil cephalus]|uniref:G-protein coupled receptor 4-like n=1 Tax=Mugil cephalus TaxID=48193 RepID=UPI001FB823A4|nr:G-protein coupled receptor 4-like [Mugil cephalus]
MEDLNNSNSSWDQNYDTNISAGNSSIRYGCYNGNEGFIVYVVSWIVICVGLPLTLLAVYAVSSWSRNDHSAHIYATNLLISDLIQLCCMIAWVAGEKCKEMLFLYFFGVFSSVGFMVCISLERYLVIAWPLWYRCRRTIKNYVVTCTIVWVLPLIFVLLCFYTKDRIQLTIIAVFLFLPLPLFIFFLRGTLKALSASLSVPTDEKRRIVAVLVVILLIYTLLFLPCIILSLAAAEMSHGYRMITFILTQISPLADLILYIFIRKGATDKLLASLCFCRM